MCQLNSFFKKSKRGHSFWYSITKSKQIALEKKTSEKKEGKET